MTIGIDEVGRGCWAGPVVAAAVGLGDSVVIDGLNDSKQLSAKKRQKLVGAIQEATDQVGIGWVWPAEINAIGLTESVRLAMHRAYEQITVPVEKLVIDGNYNYFPEVACAEAVVKADGSVTSVSAASVIAKVARDAYMHKIALKYPSYSFEKHVGYGTAIHIAALAEHGISPIHRLTYKPVAKYL